MLPRHLLKHPHGPNWLAPPPGRSRPFLFALTKGRFVVAALIPQKSGPNIGAAPYHVHYGRFGVAAGGGVNPGPGTVIGLPGGVAGVVIGELTVSFEATRVG
jgi:hypothetical protein